MLRSRRSNKEPKCNVAFQLRKVREGSQDFEENSDCEENIVFSIKDITLPQFCHKYEISNALKNAFRHGQMYAVNNQLCVRSKETLSNSTVKQTQEFSQCAFFARTDSHQHLYD